jgi:hypothetical protein
VFERTQQRVYVIKDGESCVLIDFGSGKILDHLSPMGISKVDYVLTRIPIAINAGRQQGSLSWHPYRRARA